jgi:hypothetical protein
MLHNTEYQKIAEDCMYSEMSNNKQHSNAALPQQLCCNNWDDAILCLMSQSMRLLGPAKNP